MSTPLPASVKRPIARVLVVEDDRQTGDLMKLALSRLLMDATLSTSGEEALARLTTETYDLILLDIVLPGMSGFDLCRQLQVFPQLQGIPVIFVSGLATPANKEEAQRLGAVDFIEKPVPLLQFLARVMGQLQLKTNSERESRPLWPVATP